MKNKCPKCKSNLYPMRNSVRHCPNCPWDSTREPQPKFTFAQTMPDTWTINYADIESRILARDYTTSTT